ncbi:MAG: amidase [Acidobacteriota bacterium]|jgi:aspartyl-tRNA(Asn)/glutamyl-tRNA(Gln) amidotransferase subunit A
MKTTFPEEFFFLPLGQIQAKLRAKEFKVKELTEAWAGRLEQFGPRYNALAHSLRKPAGKAAKNHDKDFGRERFRSPLHGIPYGAKDLLSYAGHPTEWGAPQYKGQVFKEHARVIAKLEGAGANCIGKLAMVELAGGGGYRFPNASSTGPGLNPWDPTRWAGGSSSGSGAAVAAGLVPFAIGSETWGSILTPAAYCGVTGLRPTYGLVSRSGAMALSWTMDKIGPLCRTAEDCGLVLQIISGGDSDDPGSAGKSFYYTPEYVRPFNVLRLGWSPADLAAVTDPAARQAFEQATQVLLKLGFQVKEVELPDLPYRTVASTIIGCEMASIFEPLVANGTIDQLVDKNQAAGIVAATGYKATDYLKALRIRRLVQEAMAKLFSTVDVLVSPSRPGVATRIDEPLDRAVAPDGSARRGLKDLGAAGNLAGLPALSLPCGFAQNLPLGISLVSRPFEENLLLAIGKQFQAETDWHQRRPPLPA